MKAATRNRHAGGRQLVAGNWTRRGNGTGCKTGDHNGHGEDTNGELHGWHPLSFLRASDKIFPYVEILRKHCR